MVSNLPYTNNDYLYNGQFHRSEPLLYNGSYGIKTFLMESVIIQILLEDIYFFY